MPTRRSVRKPNPRKNGTSVTICGKRAPNSTVICLSYPNHPEITHISIFFAEVDENIPSVMAAIWTNEDEEVEMWQLRNLLKE
jgi:hypothetical protein